jgi:selenide,water dikinase
MAIASKVGMVIRSENIPLLPEAMKYARLGLIPGGAYSNRQFFSCRVDADPKVPDLRIDLLYDPQTSGGLLISLPLGEAGKLVGTLKKEENIDACIVGEVVEGPQGKIRIL